MSKERSVEEQKWNIVETYVNRLVETYSADELINYFIETEAEYYYDTYDLPELIDIILADKYTEDILNDFPNLLALSISSE